MVRPYDRDQPGGEASGVRLQTRPDPFQGFIMAANKRSTKKASRKPKTVPFADRSIPILSTAAGSLLNMTAVFVTSGSVLLCLLTAKRFF